MTGKEWDDVAPRSDLDPGRSLTPSHYTDPMHFRAEVEHIFRAAWHPLSRSDALAEPGSYKTFNLFGEPVLLLRGKDGVLRALSNVCRHRNAVMLEGEGQVSAIRCPYHQWTYDQEGVLQAAPYVEADTSTCRLPQFQVTEWHGWVLVNLDKNASPFEANLAELGAGLAEMGVKDWVTIGTRQYPSPWNWKIMVENYAESYHHAGTHGETLHSIWPGQDSYLAETGPDHLHLKHSISDQAGRFDVNVVFPAFLFSSSSGLRQLHWYQMDIRDEGYFDLIIHVLMPADHGLDQDGIDGMMAILDQVHQEDIPVCEKVQAGVQSRFAERGPLAPQEQSLAKFHNWLAAKLG